MAIIGNFNRLRQNPQRYSYAPSKENEACFGGATLNCRKSQSSAFSQYAAQPRGYYMPYAWLLARTARDIASRNMTAISLGASATGTLGYGFPATGTMSIDANGSGALVRWGIGSAPIVLSASGAIVAVMGIVGSSVISLSGSADRGAIGWVSASGELTLSADAAGSLGIACVGTAPFTVSGSANGTLGREIYGTATFYVTADGDIVSAMSLGGTATIVIAAQVTAEAKGWMTAEAVAELTGSMVSYGLGFMAGTTEETSDLTPASIAAAVWQYSNGGLTADQLMRILAAVNAGESDGHDTGHPRFKAPGGSSVIVEADVDADGNRSNVEINA